mmetsp:Transcript_16833/g.52321  ORF Transcript_16833/g.52321 Transcript_16833/m.52321 type:complete len:226 (-) Transcript_16833:2003-2680(-)
MAGCGCAAGGVTARSCSTAFPTAPSCDACAQKASASRPRFRDLRRRRGGGRHGPDLVHIFERQVVRTVAHVGAHAQLRPEPEDGEVGARHKPDQDDNSACGQEEVGPVAVELLVDRIGHLERRETQAAKELGSIARDNLESGAKGEVGAHPPWHWPRRPGARPRPRRRGAKDARRLLLAAFQGINFLVARQLLELVAVLFRSVLDEVGGGDERDEHDRRRDPERH